MVKLSNCQTVRHSEKREPLAAGAKRQDAKPGYDQQGEERAETAGEHRRLQPMSAAAAVLLYMAD